MLTTLVLATMIFIGILNLFLSLILLVVSRPLAKAAPPVVQVVSEYNLLPIGSPFVSVHVAIHDEPPSLVMATLDALARSEYLAFEVLVIDNNTADPSTWRPVEHHVQSLGPRFKFWHFDNVVGAKAGALNLALELTSPDAVFVAVVDADYQVFPDFLASAVAASGADTQFVQFPQAYRGAQRASAVVSELGDYFETYPRAANSAQASLLTGTLSLISIAALRRVGGWPTRSITEDADLGLTLWATGERGIYIDRQAGNGLLPMDLDGLRTQRRRWVTGNIQTLLAGMRRIVRTRHGGIAVIAQLTAWLGLLGIPLTTLLIVTVSKLMPDLRDGAPQSLWNAAEAVAVITFVSVLGGHLLRAVVRHRVRSLGVTMALLWTSSLGWLAALGARPLAFRRTLKQRSTQSRSISLDSTVSSLAFIAGLVLLSHQALISGCVLIASATGLLTAPFVDRSLRHAAKDASAL